MNQRARPVVPIALALSCLAACAAREPLRRGAAVFGPAPHSWAAAEAARAEPTARARPAPPAPADAGGGTTAPPADADGGTTAPPRVVNAWLALGERESEGTRVSSPEGEQGPAPLTVLLHGLCNDPEVTCGWFRPGELRPTWQVCPAGPAPCGRGFQWAGGRDRVVRRVREAVERVRREAPGRVSDGGAVLVGFSQGAYAAVDVVRSAPGAFVGLVLVGAKVAPRLAELRAAGVRRVAFAAGDADGAAVSMRASAATLARGGFDARYESLGRAGHVLPDATSAPVGELIEWARSAEPSAPTPGVDGAATGP